MNETVHALTVPPPHEQDGVFLDLVTNLHNLISGEVISYDQIKRNIERGKEDHGVMLDELELSTNVCSSAQTLRRSLYNDIVIWVLTHVNRRLRFPLVELVKFSETRLCFATPGVSGKLRLAFNMMKAIALLASVNGVAFKMFSFSFALRYFPYFCTIARNGMEGYDGECQLFDQKQHNQTQISSDSIQVPHLEQRDLFQRFGMAREALQITLKEYRDQLFNYISNPNEQRSIEDVTDSTTSTSDDINESAHSNCRTQELRGVFCDARLNWLILLSVLSFSCTILGYYWCYSGRLLRTSSESKYVLQSIEEIIELYQHEGLDASCFMKEYAAGKPFFKRERGSIYMQPREIIAHLSSLRIQPHTIALVLKVLADCMMNDDKYGKVSYEQFYNAIEVYIAIVNSEELQCRAAALDANHTRYAAMQRFASYMLPWFNRSSGNELGCSYHSDALNSVRYIAATSLVMYYGFLQRSDVAMEYTRKLENLTITAPEISSIKNTVAELRMKLCTNLGLIKK